MTQQPDPDLPCNELVELVSDYLDGSLPAAVAARFEAHLIECPYCVEYVDQVRRTIAATRRVREPDLEPEARARLLHAFRRWHAPDEA